MRRILPALGLASVLYLGWQAVRDWPVGGAAAPMLTLGEEPVQEELEQPEPRTVHRGDRTFFVILTHQYTITAKVVSQHAYDLVWTNDFFDVDLGLIWGDQVDRLEEQYTFYQDARWLFWRSSDHVSDAERAYITAHFGNVHTIPAEGNDEVGRALRSVRAGDLVSLSGYLVEVQDAGTNVVARSSRSRTDTGAGACEVMWVDRIQIDDTLYGEAGPR